MASAPPSTTPAQAAAAFVGYIADLNADRAAYANWCGGIPTGGPNGDGNYPLTDFTGHTILVACPAKIAAIGGNITSMMAALAEAQAANVATEQVEVIFTPETGAAPVRGSPFMFAARRTVDLNVLPGSEYAEWISCLSSTGLERKLAVAALERAVGNVIDPTLPPYNVVYDFKKAKYAASTAGSNIIKTTEAVFSAADIGKMACMSNSSSAGALVGYIGQVQSPTVCALFTDLTFTTPANSSSTQTYGEMIWGTDCTAGMQQALDDAEPDGQYSPGKVVLLGGITCVTHLQFGSISVVGLAGTNCGFAALPVTGSLASQPFMCDKNSGARYGGTYKPDHYTLKDFVIYGQRYTNNYPTFRRNLEIRGGSFSSFIRGAPYAVIDGIDLYEASWDGGNFYGAFAGKCTNLRAFSNAQCGLRMGLWDLNGGNWHAEGNGCAGIMSSLSGANVNIVRTSFNGSNALATVAGKSWPIQHGSNWCEMGYGNIVTNLRMQESWSNGLVISSVDPLGIANNSGGKNRFSDVTFDDVGDMLPGQSQGNTPLPSVRAMVYVTGGTCVNNTIDGTGAGQVKTTNYATNGYYDDGNPSGNQVTLRTPGITNAASSWYAGAGGKSGDTAAASPGPWYNTSASSIGTRANVVTINGAVAS